MQRGGFYDNLSWYVAVILVSPYIIYSGVKYDDYGLVIVGHSMTVLKFWNFYVFGL